MVTDVPPVDQATTPAAFLAGRGDIARDFAAEFDETSSAGTTALKLTPRRPEPEYEYLVVAVDPGTLQDPGADHTRPPGGSFDADLQ